MKILHTADWHLGRYLQSVSLKEDQEYILKQLKSIVRQEKPDVILIAGDIYDRSVPPADAVVLFDEILHEFISVIKVPVIAIAGNHDSAQRVDCYSGILARQGLHIKGAYDVALKPVVLQDAFGEVFFYAIPYIEPEILRQKMSMDGIRTHEDCWKLIVDEIKLRHPKGKRAVCVAHCFVQGGEITDSERTLNVGGADQVPASLFEFFNYSALGHLHRPQSFLDGKVVYSGSPLKYSLSEASHKKSVSLIELDAMGMITRREVPLEPKRDLLRISGFIKEGKFVPEPGQSASFYDYVEVTILNEQPVLEVMRIVRHAYPNALSLRFPAREKEAAMQAKLTGAEVQTMRAESLAQRFFEEQTGDAIQDRHLELLQKAFDEILAKESM